MFKKYFQITTLNNQGTLTNLNAIEQEMLELAKMGIQIPLAIKQLNNPQMQLAELQRIKAEADQVSDASKKIDEAAQKAETIQMQQIQQMQNIKEDVTASANYFDLKTAQIAPLEELAAPAATSATAPQNPLKDQQFNSVEDFVTRYLDQTREVNARNEILDATSMAGDEKVAGHISRYYKITGENPQMSLFEKSELANPIYQHLPAEMKGNTPDTGVIENAQYKQENVVAFVKDVNESIKKLAQNDAKKSVSPYNLKKTAQAKTVENVIMFGPSEKRFDPFLKQPISDWHIVERNKGFGLVVDDVWNIDYEALWRGNVMDKYSRPYRDTKTGEWIGGYIQKRFEVDKWIPEGNNYQLLPGQLRKEFDPKKGVTESRLEAMRKEEASNRGYEPVSAGKPDDLLKIEKEYAQTKVAKAFNLKKASVECPDCSKKKS